MTFQSLKEKNSPSNMDKRNENCGLPYDRCYYPHWSRDSLSPVCGIFFTYDLPVQETAKMYSLKQDLLRFIGYREDAY